MKTDLLAWKKIFARQLQIAARGNNKSHQIEKTNLFGIS
jgi:hypothetical protein